MPPPFQDLDPGTDPPEFVRLLARFPFERRITGVHLHHTWRPRRDEWRGHETLQAIWYAHTRQTGWSDIAQHLTIAPDGHLWTGRDWNRPPCSAAGHNGTRAEGPFMIVLVGDFNRGAETWDGAQFDSAVEVMARLHAFFDLADDTLRFHCALDPAGGITCPGDSIDRAALVTAIAARRSVLRAPAAATGGTPPFGEDTEAWYQFITICEQNRRRLRDESPDVPPRMAEVALGGERARGELGN
jgi:hypothetical protein